MGVLKRLLKIARRVSYDSKGYKNMKRIFRIYKSKDSQMKSYLAFFNNGDLNEIKYSNNLEELLYDLHHKEAYGSSVEYDYILYGYMKTADLILRYNPRIKPKNFIRDNPEYFI